MDQKLTIYFKKGPPSRLAGNAPILSEGLFGKKPTPANRGLLFRFNNEEDGCAVTDV